MPKRLVGVILATVIGLFLIMPVTYAYGLELAVAPEVATTIDILPVIDVLGYPAYNIRINGSDSTSTFAVYVVCSTNIQQSAQVLVLNRGFFTYSNMPDEVLAFGGKPVMFYPYRLV